MMRKRKILSVTTSKCKLFKSSTTKETSAASNSHEWNRLGDAFSVPSKSDVVEEGSELQENKTLLDVLTEIESTSSNNSMVLDANLEDEIEEMNNSIQIEEEGLKKILNTSQNNLSNLISSPTSSPAAKLDSKFKGSEWLKQIPELTNDDIGNKSRKKACKKRSFVKGGFAEQLDQILSQQKTEPLNDHKATTSSKTCDAEVKLKVKDMCVSGGLLLSKCSVVDLKGVQTPRLNQDCTLVLQSTYAERFGINPGTTVTIQPPWQILTAIDQDAVYFIGPIIVDTDRST